MSRYGRRQNHQAKGVCLYKQVHGRLCAHDRFSRAARNGPGICTGRSSRFSSTSIGATRVSGVSGKASLTGTLQTIVEGLQ
jgi:hypothetical protein